MDLSPLVSIIVPARNEEICISACLKSLVSQCGISFEIIVIDDGSTDRTREIAEAVPGVRVVFAGPISRGWTGKNNALFTGAGHARGQWLLFTDADTLHRPGSLAKAVAEARLHRADCLSYSPEQEVHGCWEVAVMPVIFAELARHYRPSEVNDPMSLTAAANGQYLLITREAYESIGGHAAIAASLLEDVELARTVKNSGRKIFFRFGGDAVRTRMYRSLGQLCEGWTKNLALLFNSSVSLAAVRFGEFLLIVGTTGASFVFLLHGLLLPAGLSALLASVLYLFFLSRVRRAHFPWSANLLSLFGLPIFSYLLIRSRLAHNRGAVIWKGRSYGFAGTRPAFGRRARVLSELSGSTE